MEQTIPFIISVISVTWELIELWWWVPVPFLLWRPFSFFWLWWRREMWMFAQKKVLLEIKMPKEILKPLRAMDQVFSTLWGNTFDPPDWWEKWFEGKQLDSFQLEMIGLEGEPHLFIRCSEGRRNAIEASIYSQYPDAEISLADDYTKNVPQDLPNKDWEIWGTDFEMLKADVYPIKTYAKFFEERPEVAKEEKRLAPMANLLEGMGKMGPGEHLWIQIAAEPVTDRENDFPVRGREEADKLSKRSEKTKSKSVFLEAAEVIASGKVPGAEEEEKKKEMKMVMPPEMRLTPGEREMVEGVETKIAKRCFVCYIRFIYLAKSDVYFGGAKAIPFGFFNQFSTENLNGLKPWPKTITKIKRYVVFLGLNIPTFDILHFRRSFVRRRRLFFRYIKRFPPLYPSPGGTFILNTEELATIFHFPGRMVAPAPFVPRVESKRGEAPPGLPVK